MWINLDDSHASTGPHQFDMQGSEKPRQGVSHFDGDVYEVATGLVARAKGVRRSDERRVSAS